MAFVTFTVNCGIWHGWISGFPCSQQYFNTVVHPGFVYTGFGGIGVPKRPGQRDVDESTLGVIHAIEKTTMATTGSFFHGNYGEGVKTLPF
jgi:hypothetical protein